MLEFVCFIALLAVIFGVSFGTALAGFLKFCAISVLIVLGIGILAKLLESKRGCIFVIAASTVAVCLGILYVTDDHSRDFHNCDSLSDSITALHCLAFATEERDNYFKLGLGYIGGGVITFGLSVGLYGKAKGKDD